MSILIRKLGLAVAGMLLLMLAACSATYQNHGYVPTDRDLEDIVVGVDTRDSVAETLGSPSATGVLEDSGWYYGQSRWRFYAYKEPEIVDRQLVAISFDSEGVVTNIERFTLEDGRVVALSRRVTDSNIKGITFLRQLLGNLGNLRADQLLK